MTTRPFDHVARSLGRASGTIQCLRDAGNGRVGEASSSYGLACGRIGRRRQRAALRSMSGYRMANMSVTTGSSLGRSATLITTSHDFYALTMVTIYT